MLGSAAAAAPSPRPAPSSASLEVKHPAGDYPVWSSIYRALRNKQNAVRHQAREEGGGAWVRPAVQAAASAMLGGWSAAPGPGSAGGGMACCRPPQALQGGPDACILHIMPAVQYDAKLCDLMDTYDRAFLVHADNVGSKQFMDIRAVRWGRGPARWGVGTGMGAPAAAAAACHLCARFHRHAAAADAAYVWLISGRCLPPCALAGHPRSLQDPDGQEHHDAPLHPPVLRAHWQRPVAAAAGPHGEALKGDCGCRAACRCSGQQQQQGCQGERQQLGLKPGGQARTSSGLQQRVASHQAAA